MPTSKNFYGNDGGCNKQDNNKVLQLGKSLTGLKEASKFWNSEFNKFIVNHNFKVSTCDYII